MTTEYSKAGLIGFLDMVAAKNLMNPHTASGYKAAASRVLEQVADGTDVRSIDLDTEIRRFNNAHPGELSPSSLSQYQRRLQVAIEEFAKFVDDPASYKGRGKSPLEGNGNTASKRPEPKAKNTTPQSQFRMGRGTGNLSLSTVPTPTAGLSLEFPLRPDFLAQVVVPRDMKADEARRFSRFIMTLAHDYDPPRDREG